jgi:hypothetical protein
MPENHRSKKHPKVNPQVNPALECLTGKRILVCGGREFSDYPLVCKTLDGLLSASTLPSDTVIIHGDAAGADRLADQWAVDKSLKVERYPADWAKHRRAAGPIRNMQMLDEGKPDLVVAFSGGRGTANMVRQAREAGVPVIVIAADA